MPRTINGIIKLGIIMFFAITDAINHAIPNKIRAATFRLLMCFAVFSLMIRTPSAG